MDDKKDAIKQVVDVNYLKVWKDNYYGRSDEAKELEVFMKQNYKSHNYIPWATMLRLMMMQDVDSDVWVVDDDGSTVHTSRSMNYTRSSKTDVSSKESGVSTTGTETETTALAHFVKVGVRFMGKVMIETYPVQDTKYESPKIYDANMVNKSIQRAKARIISTITGLAFRLYETGDLQFEDDTVVKTAPTMPVKVDTPTTKPTTVTPTPATKPTTVTPTPVNTPEVVHELPPKFTDDVRALAELISDKKPINALTQVNKAFTKTYGTTLEVTDSVEVLMTKIALVGDPSLFAKTMRKIMKDKDNVE